jgi:hypothetical protein
MTAINSFELVMQPDAAHMIDAFISSSDLCDVVPALNLLKGKYNLQEENAKSPVPFWSRKGSIRRNSKSGQQLSETLGQSFKRRTSWLLQR